MPLENKRVLEIGGGTGSSSAPLIMRNCELTILDISDKFLKCIEERCRLLNINKPNLHLANNDWILNPDEKILDLFNSCDVIMMYALFEHLTPQERIALLNLYKNLLNKNILYIIIETPNRLAPWDWHTTNLIFPDILPDSLYSEFLRLSEKNKKFKLKLENQVDQYSELEIYRAGKGASFHEFELSIGLENIEIINDGHSDSIKKMRDRYCKPNILFEESLIQIFNESNLKIPKAFTRPSLDMIFRIKN